MPSKPWKCEIHFDGTKVEPGPQDIPAGHNPARYASCRLVDYSRPFSATNYHQHRHDAIAEANAVSRDGGSAAVRYLCPDTGEETTVVEFAPYDVALAELLEKDARP